VKSPIAAAAIGDFTHHSKLFEVTDKGKPKLKKGRQKHKVMGTRLPGFEEDGEGDEKGPEHLKRTKKRVEFNKKVM